MFRPLLAIINKISALWHELCRSTWKEFVLICALAFTTLAIVTLMPTTNQQSKVSTYLARQFLQGKTYFENTPAQIGNTDDLAIYQGKPYWPGGPMLGVSAIPLTLLGGTTPTLAHLHLLANLLVLILLYQLTKALGVTRLATRLIYTFGFVAATNFCGVALNINAATYTQQVLAVLFVLLALLLYVKKSNPFYIGCAVAAAFLTRFSLLGLVPFYPLALLLTKNKQQPLNLKTTALYALPILAGMGIMLLYNFARFENIFESGYRYQNILTIPLFKTDIIRSGYFHLKYIPANLYYLFVQMPDLKMASIGNHGVFPFLMRNPWGMSILVTSPFLVLSFFAKPQEKWLRALQLCTLLILLPALLWVGIGWVQYGYRYAIDAYPLLFVITILNAKKQITPILFGAILVGLAAAWMFVSTPV